MSEHQSDERADLSKRPVIVCPRCNSHCLSVNYRMPGTTVFHCQNCRHNFDWIEPTIRREPVETEEQKRTRIKLENHAKEVETVDQVRRHMIHVDGNLKPTCRLTPMGTSAKAKEIADFVSATMQRMGFVVIMQPPDEPKTEPKSKPEPGKCPKCRSSRTGTRNGNFRCFNCNHEWEIQAKPICPNCKSTETGSDGNYLRCFKCGNAWQPFAWQGKADPIGDMQAQRKRETQPIGPPFFDDAKPEKRPFFDDPVASNEPLMFTEPAKNHVMIEPTAEQLAQPIPSENEDAKLYVDFGDDRKIELSHDQIRWMRDKPSQPVPLTDEQMRRLSNPIWTIDTNAKCELSPEQIESIRRQMDAAEIKPAQPAPTTDLDHRVFMRLMHRLIHHAWFRQHLIDDSQYGIDDAGLSAELIRFHETAQRNIIESIERNRHHLKPSRERYATLDMCPSCQSKSIECIYTSHSEIQDVFLCHACRSQFGVRPNGDITEIIPDQVTMEIRSETKRKSAASSETGFDRSARSPLQEPAPIVQTGNQPGGSVLHGPSHPVENRPLSSGLGRFQEPPTDENPTMAPGERKPSATPSEGRDDGSDHPSPEDA